MSGPDSQVQTMVPRALDADRRTEVWIGRADGGAAQLVYEVDDLLLEAPNWSPDGDALLLNGAGKLWRLDLTDPSARLANVDLGSIPTINNDHVLDAERALIYLSADDGQIYAAPLQGGPATLVSHDRSKYHFLHGVSPDGATLAFVELPGVFTVPGKLALMPAAGGATRYLDAGTSRLDGPEYSPDGKWIYFNTEQFGTCRGHAQIARIPADGGVVERLVTSDAVDWFPHLSPAGDFATYLRFPVGTVGHPANLDVEVNVVRTSDWEEPVASYPVVGGQGTINVNSWSPDGQRFAFVAYPQR